MSASFFNKLMLIALLFSFPLVGMFCNDKSSEPLFLVDPHITQIGLNSATISWATNIPSYAQLSYRVRGESSQESLNVDLGEMHNQTVSSLQVGTEYSFTLIACSEKGLCREAYEGLFSTTSTISQNLKVAFIGDQGITEGAKAVLGLIRDEGADLVLHQGDFDYFDDPVGWDKQISDILGADYPYFASVGNHDLLKWSGEEGYQALLLERLEKVPDAICVGEYGVKSFCVYKGLFFILSGVGTLGFNHSTYIKDAISKSDAKWKICTWHKNQSEMQVGEKLNEVGWGAYEACREGGALIATGHEHSYHRTKNLISMQNQTVDPEWSDPIHLRVTQGSTFAFVSGIAGHSIRNQDRCTPTTYPYGCSGEWASIYTTDQGANYGALFCIFNYEGNEDKASCYFKNIDGVVVDEFDITNFITP